MVLLLDYSLLVLNNPRNILFQTMLINSEGLFVANIRIRCLCVILEVTLSPQKFVIFLSWKEDFCKRTV
jgi:hypothetical protein